MNLNKYTQIAREARQDESLREYTVPVYLDEERTQLDGSLVFQASSAWEADDIAARYEQEHPGKYPNSLFRRSRPVEDA